MSKKAVIVISAIGLIVALIWLDFLVINKQRGNEPTDLIAWDEAVKILNSGMVKQVFQRHDRVVNFTLRDGSTINTKELDIDGIIYEITKCGNSCFGIVVATE